MPRWTGRLLAGVAVVLVLALCTGLTYERVSRRTVAREYPPPGTLVDFDGSSSHLHCSGEGSPTVVLEAGLDTGGSQSWSTIQEDIATITRVCSYDRAGILWSEPRAEPRDAHRIADELQGLLTAASETPPYVLVAHSLGGLLTRVYADRYPADVAGVVLVDSSHPEQFDRYPAEVLQAISSGQASLPPRPLMKVLSAIGVYRLRLPEPRDAPSAYLWRTVPWGFSGERAARDAISSQAAEADTFGDRPLVVLSAGSRTRMPGVSDEADELLHDVWSELQAELAGLSTSSDHRTVEDAGHYIHHDDPEAVITAVEDVVRSVRGGS